MVGVLIAVLAIALFLGFRHTQRSRHALPVMIENKMLEQNLANLIILARADLPSAQIVALTEELRLIKEIETAEIATSARPWEVRHTMLLSAIRSVDNHLMVNKILPG